MHSRREFLATLSLLVAQKKISPVELTKECLARIEKLNPSLNAFITVTAEQALADARTLEAEARAGRSRGPLHGIPVALKDLIDTAGVRTTAASTQWADRVPTEDAPVVKRLKAAGAVLLGKLNMDEFAYNFTSETSHFGRILNPWDRTRSPGGSSGGSAVAVATGMCHAALGSDTGGSIRLPAALCGITGFKPTYGLVRTEGCAPLAWSLDHVGPMCRSARDAAILLQVLTGRLPRPKPPVLRPIRIGVPRALFFDQVDPEVTTAVEKAIAELGRLTAGARDVVLPALPMSGVFPRAYIEIISAESYAFHEDMLKRHPERYHPGTRKTIQGGAGVTAADYIRARREMDRLRAVNLFTKADVFATPAAPGPAFEFGKGSLIFLRNAAYWNLYGLPSISIPCGFTRSRLPIGLQLTAPAGRDDLVLALAEAYQQATKWHTMSP